jgi:hypothetical protein
MKNELVICTSVSGKIHAWWYVYMGSSGSAVVRQLRYCSMINDEVLGPEL